MMKSKSIMLLIVILSVSSGIWYALSEYNRKPADLSQKKADIALSAPELLKIFTEDETRANTLYLDKVISVKGTVKSVEKNDKGVYIVALSEADMAASISCQFDERHNEAAAKLKQGDQITVKGMCTGVLIDVVLVQCAVGN